LQTGGMVLNKCKRKVQITLLLFCLILLGQRVPVGRNEEEKETVWQLQYVSGNYVQVLPKPTAAVQTEPELNKSEGIKSEHIVSEQPVAEKEQILEAGGAAYPSVFSPLCYPSLDEIVGVTYLRENLLRLGYLKDNFYIVNATTKMTEKEFDVSYFLEADLSLQQTEEPQILIYHTHASEGFIDSRPGKSEDTVVGVGEQLAKILREKYGYRVIHDTTVFDRKDGKDNRSHAYNEALAYVEALLVEYPSVEVIIDLHRDAGEKRVVTLQGKQVAKVMLFNGLCRNKEQELAYLPNPYLKDNLAFSFQMKLIGDAMYPGLMNRIFLKDYRYNMHLAERYLLVELGTQNNTVEEANNAMEPLADILAQVLGK